jgi:hypothetical protein
MRQLLGRAIPYADESKFDGRVGREEGRGEEVHCNVIMMGAGRESMRRAAVWGV